MAGIRYSASIGIATACWLANSALCGADLHAACPAPGPLNALDAAPPIASLAVLPPDSAVSDVELAAQFGQSPVRAASFEGRLRIDYSPTSRIPPGAASVSGNDPSLAQDLSRFRAAVTSYQHGDRSGANALAQRIDDPVQRTALDWIALKTAPQPDYAALAAFGAAHPNWPANDWLRYEQEAALFIAPPSASAIAGLFANDPPRTPPGKLALARAARATGDLKQSGDLIRSMWRNDNLNPWTESLVLRESAGLLNADDHGARADRLFYAENYAAALRAAALAGAARKAALRARIDAMRVPIAPASIAAMPAKPSDDPGLLFARIHALRHADRTLEAALLLERAPHDPARLVDGDNWWNEQRLVARSLLDAGLVRQAYRLCENSFASSPPARTDAAFLAGWIALRFLDNPEAAQRHFLQASQVATAPAAISRAAYWRGRAAEALAKLDDARSFYRRAAAYPITYYGQLAARKLDFPALALRTPHAVAEGQSRDEATRVVELLYKAQLSDLALPLALDEARQSRDEAQLAALARVLVDQGDALASVEVGKRAIERGFALDEAAFPTFGVPRFNAVANSAGLAEVYAVARQESEFVGHAASGAGARGLMQVLPSTAREIARRFGLPFGNIRLTADPAFNVQIGAAFLGQLVSDEGGSQMLAFAAYNAGPARVQQWIRAYGDPRTGAVDPVDWVERIPFDETRDYVQRVSENLGVYRVRLGEVAADDRLGQLGAARQPLPWDNPEPRTTTARWE
jgi:soluble lytic murein transglycosylase